MSVLIWVQSVCNGHQQTTKVAASPWAHIWISARTQDFGTYHISEQWRLDEPAYMCSLTRAFASHIHKVWLKPKFRLLAPLDRCTSAWVFKGGVISTAKILCGVLTHISFNENNADTDQLAPSDWIWLEITILQWLFYIWNPSSV